MIRYVLVPEIPAAHERCICIMGYRRGAAPRGGGDPRDEMREISLSLSIGAERMLESGFSP